MMGNFQIDDILDRKRRVDARIARLEAELEKLEAETAEYDIALNVIERVSSGKPDRRSVFGPTSDDGKRLSIAEKVLSVMRKSDKRVWWTANEIQSEIQSEFGDLVQVTSLSPNLSRLKKEGLIVRDELKVALKERVDASSPQDTEAPGDNLLDRNSPGASNSNGLASHSHHPVRPVDPVPGGGT